MTHDIGVVELYDANVFDVGKSFGTSSKPERTPRGKKEVRVFLTTTRARGRTDPRDA